MVVLSNDEEIHPTNMEGFIDSDPAVSTCLVVSPFFIFSPRTIATLPHYVLVVPFFALASYSPIDRRHRMLSPAGSKLCSSSI